MKKISIIIAVILFAASCAPGPLGSWNYSVTGTPQGDYKGVLIVTKTQTGLNAKMTGDAGEIPFEKFTYNKTDKKVSGNFSFQGTPIDLVATNTGNELKGFLTAAGMDFPFTATRSK